MTISSGAVRLGVTVNPEDGGVTVNPEDGNGPPPSAPLSDPLLVEAPALADPYGTPEPQSEVEEEESSSEDPGSEVEEQLSLELSCCFNDVLDRNSAAAAPEGTEEGMTDVTPEEAVPAATASHGEATASIDGDGSSRGAGGDWQYL